MSPCGSLIMTRLGKDDPSVTIDMKTAFLAWAGKEEFRCTAKPRAGNLVEVEGRREAPQVSLKFCRIF
jgi:acyl-coenzyme A thioesterase PaaI-like protein